MKDRLLRASWFICLLTAAGLILTSDQQDVTYRPLGGILELLPDTNSVTEPITGILWKHGPNKVAEWDTGFGPDVDYYGTYRNRTELNKETRRLIINNMNIKDSGVYSVEVNGRLQNKTYTVKVIKKVPNPVVAIKEPCTTNSTSCILVCEGNIRDSGPVTYRWKKDEGEWMVSDSGQNSKESNITNNEEGKKVKQLFCAMKNPVSVDHSGATDNVFYKEPEPVNQTVVGGIIVALILAVGLMLGVKYRGRIRRMLRMISGRIRWMFSSRGSQPDRVNDVCELTLDPNTAQKNLSLSENNKKATHVREEQPYRYHPDRFYNNYQVLCRESLTGRCYWEVEWSGRVYISVTYKGINREGQSDDCTLGDNDKSWSLVCNNDNNTYTVKYNKKQTVLPVRPSDPHRVAVYVDCSAGILIFYKVFSDTLTRLHTYYTTFTDEPLCAGFGCWRYGGSSGSSVSLCQM